MPLYAVGFVKGTLSQLGIFKLLKIAHGNSWYSTTDLELIQTNARSSALLGIRAIGTIKMVCSPHHCLPSSPHRICCHNTSLFIKMQEIVSLANLVAYH